jgi:hypothetical protein
MLAKALIKCNSAHSLSLLCLQGPGQHVQGLRFQTESYQIELCQNSLFWTCSFVIFRVYHVAVMTIGPNNGCKCTNQVQLGSQSLFLASARALAALTQFQYIDPQPATGPCKYSILGTLVTALQNLLGAETLFLDIREAVSIYKKAQIYPNSR